MIKHAYDAGVAAALEKVGFSVPKAPGIPKIKFPAPGGNKPLGANDAAKSMNAFKPLKAPNPAKAPDSTIKNVKAASNYRPGSVLT